MRARFILAATLILLTAAVLRLYALHDYPPGPHYDEAVYLIVSRNIAFGGARFFPMVEAYQGREVLYMYLNAPFLQYIHDDIFTLHMVSAFCNLLTIAASIALGRLMFRGKHRGWLIGLTVGALITLSFPQIWLARQAFRAVTLPMMQALALAFLWRGLTVKPRDGLWLIAAGLLAGGAVYTYNSSRLFPLWLGIAGLALLIFDRARWRLRVRQGAIFFGVLILTAAPMALYAVQRPDVFFGRLTEVTQADQSVTLLESIWLHVKMFFIDGDPYLRYNIPHRPYFTLPEGLLLVAGLIVAAIRLVRRGNPLERAAYLLALLSPLMVIPSVISVGTRA
ncbi:MAG: glucosyltransferase domain-containing protein, partial [Anaerolinea sp.]|nr:glucosyltransferase domain-containing protein [Anaerolinea sp.]